MNLIAFSGPRNCVNTQYAALSGAMETSGRHDESDLLKLYDSYNTQDGRHGRPSSWNCSNNISSGTICLIEPKLGGRHWDNMEIQNHYMVNVLKFLTLVECQKGPNKHSDFVTCASCIFCSYFCLWDAKFLFQRVPGCNGIADLSWKIAFWTHKFAVGLIDMGNRESQVQ